MSWAEVVMLACFGASWPFNIRKTWTQKSDAGKSYGFLILILIGYTAGIYHKITRAPDNVLYLWLLIFVMVAFDLGLSLYYRRRRRARPDADAPDNA